MGAAGKQRVNPSQAIIAVNIRRFAIQNVWQKPILKLLLAVSIGNSYDNALAETINRLYKNSGHLASRPMAQY